MARVTYGALVTELRGSIGGTVFQGNAYGFTAKNSPNMTTPNSASQDVVKRAVVRCTQRWANLGSAVQANWNSYAATFPQFAKHNAGSQLSGYAVFLKRNIISEIFDSFRLDDPSIVAVNDSTFAATLETDGAVLLLTFNGSPAPINIDCFVFASNPVPANKPVRLNQLKLIVGFGFGSGSTDIASQYLAKFGRLPLVGEKVLMQFQNIGDLTGAVFSKQSLEIVVTSI